MSLNKEELRREAGNELCETLKYAERAANLQRHASRKSMSAKAEKALEATDALAQIIVSMSEHINFLLSK